MFREVNLAIISLLICLLMAGCSAESASTGWTVLRQASWNTNFQDVYFVDENTGWAVGDMGLIVCTSNGGAAWTAQDSRTETFLRSVYFVDGKNGWVTGDDGLIVHTEDGGNTWLPQESNTGSSLYSIHFTDKNNGAAAGSGVILHTTDGGSNWRSQLNDEESVLLSVYFADANTGWASGLDGLMLHTVDGGKSWEPRSAMKRDRSRVFASCVVAVRSSGPPRNNMSSCLSR